MFSIIIPLYNKEKTISRAVNSVLKQTNQNFELIIVNDGSTDRSLSIVKNIDNKTIKLISQKNEGVSSARNNGIKNASNEFIAFLDADDGWMPDFLDSIQFLIKKYPECLMYATGRFEYSTKNNSENVVISKYVKHRDFIVHNYLKEPHIIQMSSMCVRKSIIKKTGGFPLNIKIGEDVDFKLRVACQGTIAYYNKPKTIYYVASENNSFSYRCRFKDIFPYWKWFFYPYKNKLTLFKHTTSKILESIKRVYLPQSFSNRIPDSLS